MTFILFKAKYSEVSHKVSWLSGGTEYLQVKRKVFKCGRII